MRGAPDWVVALGQRCKMRLLGKTGPRFKTVMGFKRLPRGRQAQPGGAAGSDMIVGVHS